MTILDRYLAKTVLLHTLMVMAVLLALMTLVTFIGQQDDIGQGSYNVSGAFLVTLLQLPQQAYQLLPIGALIGAITGLGGLARDSELTVVRAAGVSVGRIAVSAALAGLVVAALLWVIGEYFAPPADQYARQYKIFSRYSQLEFAGSRSAWVREGPYFINVRRQAAENLFGGVYVYELDADRNLAMVGRAETAAQDPDGRWVLTNYSETRIDEDSTTARVVDRLVTDARFNADFFGVAVAQPDSLPLADVHAYRKHLERNQLDASVWEIAFWSRISRLVAAVAVCVFAVPFAFGPLRSAGAGARTVLGIMAGVLFVLLTQTLENSGQIYGINPLLVAWGPTVLLIVIATVAIWRVR
ncbi:MAG TPA: LPS export ABC transporter permease LptG [Steroidobacteraceae bacterium]|nr:LPS export ABC transporter permease LptG [Steroidobacteraceae bacterium]